MRTLDVWWAGPVEPISALLVIAGSHGAVALVKSLTGVDELGQLSGELVQALTASESRIDERLDRIESGLDELLEQSYGVAVRRGVRYLLDATGSDGTVRERDLDRARDAFVEATAAARSPLQQGVAERYLLLTLLGLGRQDAVPASVARVEEYTTASAFDALHTSEHSQEAVDGPCYAGRAVAGSGGVSGCVGPDYDVKRAALDSIGMSARLLAEMALVRPAAGVAGRDGAADRAAGGRDRDGGEPSRRAAAPSTVESEGKERTGVPYWAFEASPEHPLRLGALTVTVSPEAAPD